MAQPLKEILFQPAFFKALSVEITKVYPEFNTQRYLKLVIDDNWDNLELKDRMIHAAKMLKQVLPKDYIQAITILTPVSKNFTGFDAILFCQFVEEFGLDEFEASMKALEVMTVDASAEGAVRPFIKKYPQKAMKQMIAWSEHKNEHVRRLSSEGCRPLLPWNIRLHQFVEDPSPIIPILENLKNDPSLYVRKSVANNLNDISKHHSDLVLDIAKDWYGKTKQTDWIVKHGLRTLLKQGNPRAMELFGFGDVSQVDVKDLAIEPKQIMIGRSASFNFTLHVGAYGHTPLRLEYAIHFVKANGSLSKKVFQIGEKTYKPGTYTIKRKQSFKNLTTRKHYPGKHILEIVVNGKTKAKTTFALL